MATFTVGDTSPNLSGTLTSAGAAVNITGATLVGHVKRPDGTVFNLTVTIVDPLLGTWTAAWGGSDLTVQGSHKVEIQVTYSGGKIQTFGPQNFYVQPQIA